MDPEAREQRRNGSAASPGASPQGTIVEEIPIEVAPDSPSGPARTVTVRVEADLLREYVAAEEEYGWAWTRTGYLRQLPNPNDDLMRDFGTRLYDVDMPVDPQVYSTLSILVMAILAQDTTLTEPVGEGDPLFEQAQKSRKFCQYNLDNLRHAWPEILYELTEGMLKVGHKVGEQIYELMEVPGFEGGSKMVLVDVKPKSHESTAFVVDGKNKTIGLTYVRPGRPLPVLSQARIASEGAAEALEEKDERGEPVIVPRVKFIIPTHKPRNGDPRGTSHLRPAYTPWWKKQMWNPQHLAYVTRFAQPSLVAKLSKEAKDILIKDSVTGVVTLRKSIIQATNSALAKVKGGAVGSFIDTDVKMLEATSDGEVIFNSYDHEDRQIAKSILMQTLTTEEGENMARAASAIHQDVFGILISYLRSVLEWCITNEMLRPLIRYNFGEEAAATLVPVVSLGETAVQDVPSLMGAISQLANAKGLHWSQWPGIWRMFRLPQADEVEWRADMERDRKLRDAALKAAENPPAPGAGPGQGPGGGGGAPGQQPPPGAGRSRTAPTPPRPGDGRQPGPGTRRPRATQPSGGKPGRGGPSPRPRS